MRSPFSEDSSTDFFALAQSVLLEGVTASAAPDEPTGVEEEAVDLEGLAGGGV